MISHQDFEKLRLSQFVKQKDIVPLDNWEFMGREWLGEAVAFSEWLRPKEHPSVLGSLAVDFSHLPESVCTAVLDRLQLPVKAGMTKVELSALLGKPKKTHVFSPDRKTYEYTYGEADAYHLSCTVLNAGGLTYLVVMTLPRKKAKHA